MLNNLKIINRKSLDLRSIGWLRRFVAGIYNYLDTSHPYRIRSLFDSTDKKEQYILNKPETNSFCFQVEKESIQQYRFPEIISKSKLHREGNDFDFYRHDSKYMLMPSQIIYSAEDVASLGSEGLLYSVKKRSWIRQSMYDWFEKDVSIHSKYIYSVRYPEKVNVRGVCISLARPGATGYYHFIHECVPKLNILTDRFPVYDYLLISASDGSKIFIDKWLDKIGISKDKRIYATGTSHFQFEQLLFMNEWIPQYAPNKISVASVLALLPPKLKPKPERWILASRNDMDKRVLSWENKLIRDFPKIEQVFFSELTPEETIKLMGETKVFIGMHGAAFSNVIWMNGGGRVIEIVSKYFEPLYYRLSSVSSHYHYVADENDYDSVSNLLKTLTV